jgi:hypothetical protein
MAGLLTINAHVGVSAVMMGLVVSTILRSVRLWGMPTDERVAAARGLQDAPPR